METNRYDIAALERAIENAECSDTEVQKLYNNLGIAYTAEGQHRKALRSHREEKKACRRLCNADHSNSAKLIDLAIAYRRCGDAMLLVDSLVDNSGRVKRKRVDIVSAAHEQHVKGLDIARRADQTLLASRIEVQAACAAIAHSALALALDTKQKTDFATVCLFCAKAAMLAEKFTVSEGVNIGNKQNMLLSSAVNMAIALSGLGAKKRARALLQAAAVRAKKSGDSMNLRRAIANLAEESGEDGDWQQCRKYVEEWIRLAKLSKDEYDEGDALRKLGVVFFELRQYERAREVLQRALLICRDDTARHDARRNLQLVEQELEEHVAALKKYKQLVAEAPALARAGKYAEEARMRIQAGEIAFRIQNPQDTIEQLIRYFQLVDNYNCDLKATRIKLQTHLTAIANTAESFWRCKQYDDAISWATRELTAYGDDVAGQAQAWCNLGVYLDDAGKRGRSREALVRSIELAKISGDMEILKRAQNNLELMDDEPGSSENSAAEPVIVREQRDCWRQSRDATPPARSEDGGANTDCAVPIVLARGRGDGYAYDAANTDMGDSVVIISGEMDDIALPSKYIHENEHRDVSTVTPSAARSCSRPRLGDNQSRSNRSRGMSTGDSGSAGARKYVDVAVVYKQLCTKSGGLITPRNGVVEVLRSASASILTNSGLETSSSNVVVDLAGFLISDRELACLLESLAAFGEQQSLDLNISRNPLLSDAAYLYFASEARFSVLSWGLVRVLDLSCNALDAKSLNHLAEATRAGRGLSRLVELNLSKNGLGRHPIASAEACAIVLLNSASLRSIDLSLNLLSHSFLQRLVQSMATRRSLGAVSSTPCLERVDLKLNNRRRATALLEFQNTEAATSYLEQLANNIPSLKCVDIRCCGASFELRRTLYSKALSHGIFRKFVVASPGVFDDAAN